MSQEGPGQIPSQWNYGASLSLQYDAGGLTLGGPTGGQQGAGTINVSNGFFINGVGLPGGFGSQTANNVYASPNGSSGTPIFRSLANGDLPTNMSINGTIAINAAGGTRLTVGNGASGASGSPTTLVFDQTFSSAAGANPKLSLKTGYGIGVSANSFDYMSPTGGAHNLYVNGVAVGKFNAAGLTVSGTGSTTASGQIIHNPATNSSSGVVPGIFQQYAATGSVGAATSAVVNAFNLTSDTLAVSGAPGAAVMTLLSVNNTNFGGSAATGGRVNLLSSITQNAATSASSAFRSYVGLQGAINSTSGDGGGTGTEKGDYYGLWGSAQIGAAAMHCSSLTSLELDLSAATGSGVLYKSGLLISHANIGGGNDAVPGSLVDANIWVFNNVGCIGSNYGILFGRPSFGSIGINSAGTVLGFGNADTIATGIDLSLLTISGNAWVSPGCSISGLGNTVVNSLNMPASAGVSWGAAGAAGQLVMTASTGGTFLDNLGGGDMVFRTTASAEFYRIKATGVMKMTGAGAIVANGAVATTMTSLGPIGSHTTVQEWLVIQNSSGTVRWIPCY